MDIAQIRTLVHVAELGSISKAADRLGIAQPALSRQIHLMEAELGAPLFIRHGRGMLPTDLGHRILEPAVQILSRLDVIHHLADDGRASLFGQVRFGMTSTVAAIMTVPLARAVKKDHPHLSLCISSAFSGHLLDWLKRQEVDCCVSYDPEPTGAVRTRPVLIEDLLLVGAGDRGLSLEKAVPFSALAKEPLVLPSPRHGLRSIVESCAAKAGILLKPHIEADSLSAMIDLVRAGFGCTILPLAPIHEGLARGDLTAAPLIEPEPTRRVVLTYPADRPVSPSTRYTAETFVAVARELVKTGVWAGKSLAES